MVLAPLALIWARIFSRAIRKVSQVSLLIQVYLFSTVESKPSLRAIYIIGIQFHLYEKRERRQMAVTASSTDDRFELGIISYKSLMICLRLSSFARYSDHD